jgi:hypothetical protein
MMGSGIAVLVLTCVVRLQAEDAASLNAKAQAAYNAKEYAQCAELYAAAVNAGGKSAGVSYNAACCHALAGNKGEAFVWLTKAIQASWRDCEHLKNDTDLTPLHSDDRWLKTIERCEKAAEAFVKSLKEPALRDELLKRMKEDQRIRMAANPNMEEWTKIDADNTAYMKSVIDKHGWPGKSMVGDDGALAAFLMVQHADRDPAFQKKCLPLMEAAVLAKEASASQLALLTDRVLLAEGKQQRYGSQFTVVDGKSVPRPIEDPEHVDARRAAVGLPPLAEYAKQMESMQKRMEESTSKSVKEPALREELMRRMKEAHNASQSSDSAAQDKVGKDNAAYIKAVVEKYGWPGNHLVGWDGAQAARVLALSTGDDLPFRKKCLTLIEAAVQANDASPEHLAEFTDSILLAEGKPQRYGTQLHTVDGAMVPREMEDPANVDARRKAIGLGALTDSLREMKDLQQRNEEQR